MTTSQFWTDTPEAAALLDAIGPEDLHVVHRYGLGVQPDRYILRGEVVLELEKLHVAATERMYGCSFEEAEKKGQVRRWVCAFQAQPDPEDVLAERFGDPNALGSSNTDGGWTQAWRAQFPAQRSAAA